MLRSHVHGHCSCTQPTIRPQHAVAPRTSRSGNVSGEYTMLLHCILTAPAPAATAGAPASSPLATSTGWTTSTPCSAPAANCCPLTHRCRWCCVQPDAWSCHANKCNQRHTVRADHDKPPTPARLTSLSNATIAMHAL
jgi:hypothetical protein